jgi:hypothetical protein
MRRLRTSAWRTPATAGEPAIRRFLALALLAVAAATIGSLGGGTRLVDAKAPPFLGRALGAPVKHAALVRRPGPGVTTEIGARGLRVESDGHVATLSLEGAHGPWRGYANGATRPGPGAMEAATFTPGGLEQLLTVPKRLGPKTWGWRLDSPGLTPHAAPDGSVLLYDSGRRTGLVVPPVRILSSTGRDITPDGLRWTLAGDTLELRLADARLPQPYVIDPGIVYRSSTTANNGAGSTTLTISKPAGVMAGDILVATVYSATNSVNVSGWGGFTSYAGMGMPTLAENVAWKQATGSEASSYTFTFSGSVAAVGTIVDYPGAQNTSGPFPTSSFNNGSGTTSLDGGTITPGVANSMLALFYGTNNANTFTAPPGMQQELQYTSGSLTIGESDLVQASSGVTPDEIATAATAPTRWLTHFLAIRPDSTVPTTATLTNPGSWVHSVVTLSASAADNAGGSGIASVDFQYSPTGTGTWASLGTDTTSPYNATWDTTGLADGTGYDLRVVATDNAGNTKTSTVVSNVRVDNTAPSGKLVVVAPPPGAPAVTLQTLAQDDGSGVAQVTYEIKGKSGSWSPIATSTTSPWKVPWQASRVPKGRYTIRARIRDSAGNEAATQPIQVALGGAPPPKHALEAGLIWLRESTPAKHRTGGRNLLVDVQARPASARAHKVRKSRGRPRAK